MLGLVIRLTFKSRTLIHLRNEATHMNLLENSTESRNMG